MSQRHNVITTIIFVFILPFLQFVHANSNDTSKTWYLISNKGNKTKKNRETETFSQSNRFFFYTKLFINNARTYKSISQKRKNT